MLEQGMRCCQGNISYQKKGSTPDMVNQCIEFTL